MNKIGILQIVSMVVLVLVQVVFLRTVVLFHVAFCFLYVSALLLLPVDLNKMALLLIGFGVGFFVDIFYDSLGMHALACVFIMFIRNNYLNLLTPQGGYDSHIKPSIAVNGLQWFLVYALPLIVIHHGILFFVEAGGFGLFWFTLGKILASAAFTLLVIVIVQLLFPDSKRI